MNRKAHVACNINYLFENEELIKVTAHHVHCVCGDISETVTDSRCYYGALIGSDIMAYRIEPIPMTLSHLRGHSLLQACQMLF